ncbi:MAG: hypothetical protein BGO98_33020 [Myxococcales bacterium 68-20]|nr:MAG: hypothetical protein BGO98_33020 [Myxococcales bacterium 68-20]
MPGDGDLEHATIHIHRAWDRRARKIMPTKTRRAGRFSIEPELLPLLRDLFNRAGGKGPILDLLSEPEMAVGLRRWLAKAGVAAPSSTRRRRRPSSSRDTISAQRA